MKKYVLGAFFILGTMAAAANAGAVGTEGTATTDVAVEVSGKVLPTTQKSLVVDITQGESSTGTGFAFGNLNLLTSEVVKKQGKFTARIETSGKPEVFKATPTVKLVQNGVEKTGEVTVTPNGETGTSIVYTTTGGMDTTMTTYTGVLDVAIEAAGQTESFTDNSVSLRVAVTGQTETPSSK